MANKLFISIEDVKRFRQVSVDQETLNIYIDEAQLIDLRPILGDALYFDFAAKHDVSGDPMYTAYQELLLGKAYTYLNIPYVYDGFAPTLSYFALARLRANPIKDTRFGAVVKSNDQSVQPTAKDLDQSVISLRSIAISYQSRITDFLERNASTYPLYNSSVKTEQNSMGVGFFDPDTENVNNTKSNGRSIW